MKYFVINNLLSMKYDFLVEVIDCYNKIDYPCIRLSDLDLSTSEGQNRFSCGEYIDDLTYDCLCSMSPCERDSIFKKVLAVS